MAIFELDGMRVEFPSSGRYWVAPNATIIGKVRIEEDASVWFNSVIRGDNEEIVIGTRSNIQEGCVLHTDPGFPMLIGPDCTIGHMAMLHGCTIGAGSLIGIGAVVLNGAHIGEGCMIGAGALITEEKEIPARSVVVGAPGRVVRQVGDDDLVRMQRGAEVYVRKWKRYATALRPQSV